MTALDVERRVRDPEGRDENRVGRDQYDADDLDPGRRPTGGDAGYRARDRSLRGRGRARPGRGPPHELRRQGCLPLRDADRRDVRLGRLRGGARASAPLGRLRGAPGGATASARRGLGGRARDRARRLRRDLEPRRRGGVRRGRDHRGRRRHPAHGLSLPRPGARDDIRDDRGGATRAPGGAGRRPPGGHGRRAEGHRHLRLQVDADRRRRRASGRRRGRRAGDLARGRLPRGERRGRRAGRRRPAASTSPTRLDPRSRGPSWRRRRRPTGGSAS